MKFRFLALFLLAFVGACFAASAKPVPVLAKFSSPKPFSGERLFFVLDSLGGGGNWMEWEAKGVNDPSVADAISSLGAKPEMVWVLSERKKPLFAALVAQGAGEMLVFCEIPALDAKPEPLKLNEVMDPNVVFRDYRQVSPNEFVHRDQDNLRVMVSEQRIRFAYVNPDKEPLKFDYSLMRRAFVQSTHGVFNWQPWHWYMASWNSKYLIKNEELEAILATGRAPAYFSVFKAKTAAGEWVEFRANGNGFAEMVISKP